MLPRKLVVRPRLRRLRPPFDTRVATSPPRYHRRGLIGLCIAASIAITPLLGAQESAPSAAVDSVLASLLPASLRTAALGAAPELAVRRAEVAAAQARRDAAGFAGPMTLGFESEESRNGRLDRGNTRVDIGRDFLPPGQRRGERAVAEAEVVVARATLRAAERHVLADAVRALYMATGWRAISRRLAAQDSLLTSAETSVRARFAVGDARYVDVLRLRTERLRVQTDVASAETERETAAILLATLIGGDSAAQQATLALLDSIDRGGSGILALMTMADRLPEAPPLDALVAASGEVQVAEAQVAQAEAQQRLLRARQRPVLSAAAGLQRVGPEGDEGPALGPVVSVGLTLPFTAGRANRAALTAAERQTAVAVAARNAAAVSVRGGVAAARARYEAARRRAAAFDATLLRAARDERESALAAYRTADLSLLELLDFERALSRAEIERSRAALDALTALADLLSGSSSPTITSSSSEAGAGRDTDDR